MEIMANVRQITPDMAYELLTNNTKNYRRIEPRTVSRYADEMKAGRWELNGEPITFAEDGRLLNGQHRLSAVIEAGVTVPMLVVTGVKNSVVTYDDGRLRSAVDMAANMGLNTNNRMLAVAAVMVREDFRNAVRARISKRTCIEYAALHENELKQARSCTTTHGGGTKIMNRAWAAATAYLLIREGHSTSVLSDFFQVVNSGLPITGRECSPALVMRNMFFGQATTTRHSDEPDNMHYLIMAFNDFALGVRRQKTYAVQSVMVNRAEELWHKVRRMDGLE